MATPEEITEFTQFALELINNGGAELSMDELYDQWRRDRPDPAAQAENIAAIAGAIQDYIQGDRGQPAGELSRELRRGLKSAADS